MSQHIISRPRLSGVGPEDDLRASTAFQGCTCLGFGPWGVDDDSLEEARELLMHCVSLSFSACAAGQELWAVRAHQVDALVGRGHDQLRRPYGTQRGREVEADGRHNCRVCEAKEIQDVRVR